MKTTVGLPNTLIFKDVQFPESCKLQWQDESNITIELRAHDPQSQLHSTIGTVSNTLFSESVHNF